MNNYPTWFQAQIMELDKDLDEDVISIEEYWTQYEYLLQDLEDYER